MRSLVVPSFNGKGSSIHTHLRDKTLVNVAWGINLHVFSHNFERKSQQDSYCEKIVYSTIVFQQ